MSTVSDTFVEPDGTLLQDHAIPGGYAWSKLYGPTGDLVITTNHVNTNATGGGPVFVGTNIVPLSADYAIRCQVDRFPFGSGAIQPVDIIGRWQPNGERYYLRNWFTHLQLYKYTLAGGEETIGDWSVGGNSIDEMELRFTGTEIAIYANGGGRVGATDSSMSGVGINAICFPTSISASDAKVQPTGYAIDCAAGFAALGPGAKGAMIHHLRNMGAR